MSILKKNHLAAALGAAFLATSVAPLASADVNPFAATPLNAGYDLANYGSHEGSCGGDKDMEGKCGEGKAKKEGQCGGKKDMEGKCGEGKAKKEGQCGGKKDMEGKCGESKAKKEGKCGEGKCGGNKAK